MFSASPRSQPTASLAQAGLPLERRLAAEWDLLHRLAARNPHRLADLASDDLSFRFRLLRTPGLVAEQNASGREHVLNEHDVRIVFQRFFPAVPLELYLGMPVRHPNIHPESGFVCLWDRHRVSHTVEHAVHKLAAMLGWTLWNREAAHVMQPEALRHIEHPEPAILRSLAAPLLLGVERECVPHGPAATPKQHGVTRRRLS